MVVVNGWHLFAHPLFVDQVEKLTSAVERVKAKNPADFQRTADAKLLASLYKLALETIPSDPTRSEYRQGGALGANRRHWFRAKFGGQRFRLFFRYNASAKVIVYAWVNDRDSLRAYGSKNDAYAVFKSMLDRDAPPDDWDALANAASELKDAIIS
jgi:toxin YhaV